MDGPISKLIQTCFDYYLHGSGIHGSHKREIGGKSQGPLRPADGNKLVFNRLSHYLQHACPKFRCDYDNRQPMLFFTRILRAFDGYFSTAARK